MIGVALALLYAASMIVFGSSVEATYLSATAFLYYWHLLWTIGLGVVVCTFALVPVVVGTVVGSSEGIVGTVLGFLLGGSMSLAVFVTFMFRRLLYVGGSYLLSTALVGSVWDTTRIAVGCLILFVAFFMRKRSS